VSRRRERSWLVVSIVLAPILAGGRSRADDVDACVASHETGQVARRQGKLLAARQSFRECASASCPAVLQEDCSRRLAEIEASVPTVVIEARDATGRETADVAVSVDGMPAAERLGGLAIPLDPGERQFRFESAGTVVESRVILREGEKNRKVRVDFSSLAPRASAAPSVPTVVRTPAPSRPIPTAAYVLGGLGLIGLGSFAVWGILGKVQQASFDDCKPNCADAKYDVMQRDYVIADASFGVGIVALAVAGILVLTRPSTSTPPSSKAPKPAGRADSAPIRF